VFSVDLQPATVVMLYLLPELNVRLIPQLEKLRPGSRIVSHDFDMKGVTTDRVFTIKAPEFVNEEGYSAYQGDRRVRPAAPCARTRGEPRRARGRGQQPNEEVEAVALKLHRGRPFWSVERAPSAVPASYSPCKPMVTLRSLTPPLARTTTRPDRVSSLMAGSPSSMLVSSPTTAPAALDRQRV
jgi:hypothetical protein